ncbi:MAG: 30S ribosomal protein S8 [Verrucomicrobia bacterium]|nr:MAG: 30S ribosomal protein S8 [Verrucomicrobiota bacterium]
MTLSDPIGDMLTRIRNACHAGHETVDIPHSKLKAEIARVLQREGFIRAYTTEGRGAVRTLRLYLKYDEEGRPVIRGLKRISRPGLRQYAGVDSLPRVLSGLGIAILSTSAGVMTEREARRRRVGGEVLCHVW